MALVPEGKQELPVPYLLVDDTDGRVLAEVTSAEEALRILVELDPSQHVSLVKVDSAGGSFAHADSIVAVRPLLPNLPPPRE
jgi:hypothetical protein